MAMFGGGAWYYYTSTQNTIQLLVADNATLKSNYTTAVNANQTNLNTIDQLQDAYVEIQLNYEQLEVDLQVTRMQNAELRERLGRHDIGALAYSKPKLVERTINNASKKTLRCFEILSGSPLTEQERNATSERQFNNECPWLWTGASNP